MTNQAITHSMAQTWEATIQAVCYVKVLKTKVPTAIALAVVTNANYVFLAVQFIR